MKFTHLCGVIFQTVQNQRSGVGLNVLSVIHCLPYLMRKIAYIRGQDANTQSVSVVTMHMYLVGKMETLL